jgi:hypothetical protein
MNGKSYIFHRKAEEKGLSLQLTGSLLGDKISKTLKITPILASKKHRF